MAYIIRKANINDLDVIISLLYQVHDVHVAIRPDLFIKGEKKYEKEELKTILKSNNKDIFVYDENGVRGYIIVFYVKEESKSKNNIKTLYIDDLCVSLDSKRKGIGKALYEYIKKYAKENKFYNITLNVWEGNDSAYSFYKSLGLKILKTTLEEKL